MHNEPDLSKAQLFLDDTWIEDANFVSRQWHQPRKFPDPVLKPEHPWEHWCPVMYGTVLHWRGRFRMWYNCWTREPKPRVCYAESTDGVAWEKPRLGVCEFDGSKDNNIVLQSEAPRYIDDISVIDDPDDGEWPIKALFWEGKIHDLKQPDWGIWAARSKDCIHWDRSPGLVLPHWGDRFNAASVKIAGKYVVLGRAPGSRPHGRQAWRTESRDLIHWSEPKKSLARDVEDPVNMEYYSATLFPYEGLTLGSIERMYMSPDRLDVELVWSYDAGRAWQRAPKRPAFLSPSEGARRWDDTWVNLPTNGPIRHQGRLWFYYSARSGAHGSPYPFNHGAIGLALLRVDGFASLMAGERTGLVVTKPMRWPKADVHVNADPRRDLISHPGFCSGDVRVEARDAAGKAMRGFTWDDCEPVPQTVNDPDASRKVLWRGGRSLRRLAGKRLRLAFRLRDAHLYSFRARG